MVIGKKVSSEGSRKNAILIFSKSAELGNVKTRLRALLPDEQLLKLHLAFLQDAIAKARSTSENVILYLSGNHPLPFDPQVPVRPQQGSDLGQRLQNAFADQLRDSTKVVIIGTDSPTFSPDLFEAAFQLLDEHDIVIGPAEDGGYYLIGLSTLVPEIFANIDWGTELALAQTLAAAASRIVALLPSCYDIDTPEDLLRLRAELADSQTTYTHHTNAFLCSL